MIPAQQLIFFALGIIYVFFSISLLFRKKVKAFYFFGGLLFIVGYSTITTFLTTPKISKDFIFLFDTKSPLQFLYGPCYYFFLLYLVNPNRPFVWRDCIHFIPALYCVFNLIPLYELSNEEKLNVIINGSHTNYYTPLNHLQLNYLKLALGLGYTAVGFIKFRIFFKESGLHLFKQNKAIINWLILDFILRGVSMYFIYAGLKNTEQIANSYYLLLMSVDSIMNVFFIIYFPSTLKGLRFKITNSTIHYASDHQKEIHKTFTYQAQVSDEEKSLLLRLNDLMHLDQLFIDEFLNINTVAKRLLCKPDQLRMAIQHGYGKDFNEYLLDVRVDFVRDRLQHDHSWINLSQEQIAARSGFKTRIELENALKIKN